MAFLSIQNVVTMAAWSFFLIQLGYLSYNAMYHPEMSTIITTEPLFPGPFPLKLQVCVNPGFDEDKLTSYGYISTYESTPFFTYLFGFKTSGKSMVGWGGLNSSGGTQDPAGIHEFRLP